MSPSLKITWVNWSWIETVQGMGDLYLMTLARIQLLDRSCTNSFGGWTHQNENMRYYLSCCALIKFMYVMNHDKDWKSEYEQFHCISEHTQIGDHLFYAAADDPFCAKMKSVLKFGPFPHCDQVLSCVQHFLLAISTEHIPLLCLATAERLNGPLMVGLSSFRLFSRFPSNRVTGWLSHGSWRSHSFSLVQKSHSIIWGSPEGNIRKPPRQDRSSSHSQDRIRSNHAHMDQKKGQMAIFHWK